MGATPLASDSFGARLILSVALGHNSIVPPAACRIMSAPEGCDAAVVVDVCIRVPAAACRERECDCGICGEDAIAFPSGIPRTIPLSYISYSPLRSISRIASRSSLDCGFSMLFAGSAKRMFSLTRYVTSGVVLTYS